MTEIPKQKYYKQTTLNSYFNVTGEINRFVEVKSLKRNQRLLLKSKRMDKEQNGIFNNCSHDLLSFISDIKKKKPKIPLPILSDNEDDNNSTNNDENNSFNRNLKKVQITTSTPKAKRMRKSKKEPLPSTSTTTSSDDDDVNDSTTIINRTSSKSKIEILDNTLIKTPESSPTKCKKTEDKKKPNYHELNVMKQFLTKTPTDDSIKHLLTIDDKKNINEFLSMNTTYQFLIMKLFTWEAKWYNIFKFTVTIRLSLTKDEIKEMYHKLSANCFVETSYTDDNLIDILNNMELKDLRAVSKKVNLTGVPLRTRDNIIKQLLRISSTQSTLSKRSMTDIIKEHAKKEMGYCVKLSDYCRDFLYKIYLLNTFTNSKFHQPRDYFNSVGYLNVKFPEFHVEQYQIFYVESEFQFYMDAIKCELEIEKALKDKNAGLLHQICKDVFQKLQTLTDSIDESRPVYLKRFSAIHKYISIISSYCNKLINHYHADVCEWLEYFVKLDLPHHKRAFWYNKLSLIYTSYFKQYDRAAQIIIDAFKQDKQQFSDIDLHELAKRGKLLHKKTYKVARLHLDVIIDLSPPTCDRDWPEQTIERHPIRTNELGKKRKYVENDGNGGKQYSNVEDVARDFYLRDGYTDGDHFENALICALFNIFFWDIIYDNHVPGTLISNVQKWPLDLHSEYFYENRKDSIDQRLDEISSEWTQEEFLNFAKQIFNHHSHESSISNIDSIIENVDKLCEILTCFDRQLLMKIFKRMVINLKAYKSGFPDLFLWSLSEKKCKFVEVKGENDQLSIKQKLWLNYLMDNGADVEVCHVHSIGSKKKLKKKSD